MIMIIVLVVKKKLDCRYYCYFSYHYLIFKCIMGKILFVHLSMKIIYIKNSCVDEQQGEGDKSSVDLEKLGKFFFS